MRFIVIRYRMEEKAFVFQDGLGSGDSYLIHNALPDSDAYFSALQEEVKWTQIQHKGGRVPRDICVQGSIIIKDNEKHEPIYRHPVDEEQSLDEWTPTALCIKEQVEKLVGQDLNHALIQRYVGGTDFIGEHSDKTLDILIGSKIVNYSVGATRKMILKHKKTKQKQVIRLPHNSLFVLGWKTNREWLHAIKQDKRREAEKDHEETSFGGQRISLTLRTIATFRNRRTGDLWGQGAPKREDITEEDDVSHMAEAFSAENKLSMEFDWDKYYGSGYRSLCLKGLNPLSGSPKDENSSPES